MKVTAKWAVGVYGVFAGRGPGPWTETTRRVDGADVSMYAEPGAVVIRLVRRTAISSEGPKEIYKYDEVRVLVFHVVVLTFYREQGISVKITAARDTMKAAPVCAVGRQP